jgi:hypothetical protein
MNLKIVISVVLLSAALMAPAHAKKPVVADEAVIRGMIEKVYAPYTQPIPDAPEDRSAGPDNEPGAAMDGYELPYTATLDKLVAQWSALMQATDELYGLNSFDWYCQCQDNDNAKSKLVRQTYKQAGKDRIDVSVLFSPGLFEGRDMAEPLLFRFKREGGAWKLDDLKFHRSGSLRRGLAEDIQDATNDKMKAGGSQVPR